MYDDGAVEDGDNHDREQKKPLAKARSTRIMGTSSLWQMFSNIGKGACASFLSVLLSQTMFGRQLTQKPKNFLSALSPQHRAIKKKNLRFLI